MQQIQGRLSTRSDAFVFYVETTRPNCCVQQSDIKNNIEEEEEEEEGGGGERGEEEEAQCSIN